MEENKFKVWFNNIHTGEVLECSGGVMISSNIVGSQKIVRSAGNIYEALTTFKHDPTKELDLDDKELMVWDKKQPIE